MVLKEQFKAAVAAGDWETAASCAAAIARSKDSGALVELGRILRQHGRLEEAEAILAPAAESSPTVPLLDQLVLVQYQRQDFGGCERTLERLIQVAQQQTPLASYKLLAKLKANAGNAEGARAVMAQAVAANAGATDFFVAYADMLPHEEAVSALEDHLQKVSHDPPRVAYVLARITVHRAAYLRSLSGLPACGVSWPDTCQWPDPKTLPHLKQALHTEIGMGSKRATALLDLACVGVAESDWEGAEAWLAKLRNGPKRTAADFTAFGSRFHAALDAMTDEDIFGGLASVERVTTQAQRADVGIFIGSDLTYFQRFTLPFLRQVDAAGLPIDVHVHILDGAAADWMQVRDSLSDLASVRATLTAEASGAAARGVSYARQYYHAVRFVRLFQELLFARRPMFMFDADVAFLRDPRTLLSSLVNFDLALRTNPIEFSPNLKITATCVGISPTARGLEFARRVAAYVIYWKNRATWGWGVDQLGLLSAYAHMAAQGRQPATLFLDDTAVNDKVGESGVVRFLSGIDKYGRSSGAD